MRLLLVDLLCAALLREKLGNVMCRKNTCVQISEVQKRAAFRRVFVRNTIWYFQNVRYE